MDGKKFFWERQGASFCPKWTETLYWAKIEKKSFGNVRERLFGQNGRTHFTERKSKKIIWERQSNPDVAFSCLRLINHKLKLRWFIEKSGLGKLPRPFWPKRRTLTFPNDFFSIFAQESVSVHFGQKDAPWRSHTTSVHFGQKDAFRSSQVFGQIFSYCAISLDDDVTIFFPIGYN